MFHGSLGLLYGNLHGAEEPSAVNFGRAGTVVVVVGGETLTPLFQTSFLLLKTQVNLTLPTTCVLPFGEQEAPAFAVAEYALVTTKRDDVARHKAKKIFFIFPIV